jgi:hypothetical protein
VGNAFFVKDLQTSALKPSKLAIRSMVAWLTAGPVHALAKEAARRVTEVTAMRTIVKDNNAICCFMLFVLAEHLGRPLAMMQESVFFKHLQEPTGIYAFFVYLLSSYKAAPTSDPFLPLPEAS